MFIAFCFEAKGQPARACFDGDGDSHELYVRCGQFSVHGTGLSHAAEERLLQLVNEELGVQLRKLLVDELAKSPQRRAVEQQLYHLAMAGQLKEATDG